MARASHTDQPWLSSFVYDSGTRTYTCELALRHWTDSPTTVGERRIAAAGTGAVDIIRRDGLIDVPLRFYEDDWPNVWRMIQWGQTEERFTWYPDASDTDTVYSVYLQEPAAGSRIQYERNPEFSEQLELTITLRLAGSPSPFGLVYDI